MVGREENIGDLLNLSYKFGILSVDSLDGIKADLSLIADVRFIYILNPNVGYSVGVLGVTVKGYLYRAPTKTPSALKVLVLEYSACQCNRL